MSPTTKNLKVLIEHYVREILLEQELTDDAPPADDSDLGGDLDLDLGGGDLDAEGGDDLDLDAEGGDLEGGDDAGGDLEGGDLGGGDDLGMDFGGGGGGLGGLGGGGGGGLGGDDRSSSCRSSHEIKNPFLRRSLIAFCFVSSSRDSICFLFALKYSTSYNACTVMSLVFLFPK